MPGSCSSSFKQGIWMMSFMPRERGRRAVTSVAVLDGPVSQESTLLPSGRPGCLASMEIATLTRRRPAQDVARPRAARGRRLGWPRSRSSSWRSATLVGFVVYPTYPNYDSYYSLLWGRELLHGTTPSLRRLPRADRASAGDRVRRAARRCWATARDRVMVGCTLVVASSCWSRASTALARAAFTPLVGLVAARAAVHALRLPVPGRARLHRHPVPGARRLGRRARGRAPAARRRRSACCSPAPGCMRPEAWLLIGLYLLWMRAGARPWRDARSRYAALAAVGPVIWVPSTSSSPATRCSRCTHTSGLAEELGRTQGPVAGARGDACSSSRASTSCRCSSRGIAGLRRSRSWLDAAARCRCPPRCWSSGVGDVRARRARRPVGHRPLPAGARRSWSWSSPPSRSAAGRCSRRGRLRTRVGGRRGRCSWSTAWRSRPRASTSQRLRQRARLPRRRRTRRSQQLLAEPAVTRRRCAAARCRRRTTSWSPTRAGS